MRPRQKQQPPVRKWIMLCWLEREKWSYEKQEKTASANMTTQLEHMKKYTEMKQMGFNNKVIGEMVPELVPLINSIMRNS
jgi:hypothetical protein